jgi:Na+/H+ antiporter 1
MSALTTKATRGRLRPPVGWTAVEGAGTTAGTVFTLSLLVATVDFTGTNLKEAPLGVLTAAVASALFSWSLFLIVSRLPPPLRTRALLGRSEVIIDLADPVDDERDHVRGPADAEVTMGEYGDFEFPYCGQAEPIIRELPADFGDLRYAPRHLPLSGVTLKPGWPLKHPRRQPPNAPSGPRTICCWNIKQSWEAKICSATPISSVWTRSASPRTYERTDGLSGLTPMWKAPTSAAWRARRPSSLTVNANTAPTTSPTSAAPSSTPKPSLA